MLVNGVLLGGMSRSAAGRVISGNTGVHQFCRIGEFAMIGGVSKITQDVVPYFMVDGHGLCAGINRIGMRRAGIGRGRHGRGQDRVPDPLPDSEHAEERRRAARCRDADADRPPHLRLRRQVLEARVPPGAASRRGSPAAAATPAPTILPISDAVSLPRAA